MGKMVEQAPGMAPDRLLTAVPTRPSSGCWCHPHWLQGGCSSSRHLIWSSCIQRNKRNFLFLELPRGRKRLNLLSSTDFSLSLWTELSHVQLINQSLVVGEWGIVISLDQGFLFYSLPSIPWTVF